MSIASDVLHANVGFDHVFSNNLDAAKKQFASYDSAPHLMGLGCIAFLEAALGMEAESISEATRVLTLAEARAKKEARTAKADVQTRRFSPGLEYEVLHADSILLLGLAQALSESYTGYLQCMYSLNNAHSKFTKIYNLAFPNGVDRYATPSSSPEPSPKALTNDHDIVNRSMSLPPHFLSTSSSTFNPDPTPVPTPPRVGFFSRWNSSSKVPSISSPSIVEPDGPIEELIISGAAFGYGLFNLVFSLLPPKIRGVVGFLGFKSDRQLALRALAVAATRNDAHAVLAGLTLMSYYGAVLSLSGYQADETRLLKQYQSIVTRLQHKYPLGSLWILNSAKISSLSGDPERAVTMLESGLSPERLHSFPQADALLVFELAWTLFGQRKYLEAANMFLRLTEINTWSHATYYYIAAGCYISVGNHDKAQELLDQVPVLMEKRRLVSRELPTEVLIKKKIAFYKNKRLRREGAVANYARCIRLSIAEELGLLWNVHHRISVETAEAHVREWIYLTPTVEIKETQVHFLPPPSKTKDDLDTPEELALRSLLLGVVYKAMGKSTEAKTFLHHVSSHNMEAKWYKVLALFELSVLRLQEANNSEKSLVYGGFPFKDLWSSALQDATDLVNKAAEISATIEVSSRIESRISMLRDEISLKRKKVFGT